MTTKFESGGVTIYPSPARTGDMVTISYDGILAKSGADQVYLHAGYDQDWKEQQFLKMVKTSRGWEKTFNVNHANKLNFCFKDSANNWDNNQGRNWIVPIEGFRY